LKRLEGLDAESEEFRTGFVALRQAVLDHAAHEEAGALPLLRSSVDADELDRLGGRYETAKASAPTHPHPHAPDSPPGNLLLGPVAAVIDRVRDALRGA
jgi:hypothetical protein